MGLSWVLTVQPIGPNFSETRKLLRKAIGPGALADYDGILQKQALNFVKSLKGFTGDAFHPITHSVGAVISSIAYGENINEVYGEELTRLNNEESEIINTGMSNTWLVNLFPWRKFISARTLDMD